jgi:2-polyprenyl-3-methyl-5-hydroxy-6-metoxy-1,4-benzoquinol methylase
MTLTKFTACPICHHAEFSDFIILKDYSISQEDFTIQVCNSCGLKFTNPQPSASSLARYYQSEKYISHNVSANLFGFAYTLARNLSVRKKLKLVQQFHPSPGYLLDFGCGTGEFLKHAQQKKWKVSGIEPNALAREKASKLLGQEIDSQLIESDSPMYEAITLWHVLEHVQDIETTLTKIRKALKVTGNIFIAVPNHNSYDAKHYTHYWAGYDVPRHLWHFEKKTLNALLNKLGFKIVHTIPMKLDSFYVSLLSEGYKNPRGNKVIKWIQAFNTGLNSNIQANKTGEYSSIIYIASKA